MIKIKEKEVGLPPQIGTDLFIRVEFELSGMECRIFWQVKDDIGNKLLQGGLDIPEDVYELWGLDDSIIEDFVLTELQLERL